MTADPSRPLPNTRHERFAQEIEGGTDAADAYARAGYKGGYANARKLKSHAGIRARVAWLQARRAEMHAAVDVTATHIAVQELAITKERVLGALAEIAFPDRSQADEGAPLVTINDQRKALVDLGKYLGLFIQRHEHGAPGDFARFSDTELTEEITREASELGIVLPGNETAH